MADDVQGGDGEEVNFLEIRLEELSEESGEMVLQDNGIQP